MLEGVKKYRPYVGARLADRTWPSNRVAAAPRWCSVDLRDGNQALIDPMNLNSKLELFSALVAAGFKEIEVGFPSASQTDYDAVRALIELERAPEDVFLQVLVPAREQLVERTFSAVRGAKNVIMHIYLNTSPVFRRVVFGKDREGIKRMAVEGARMVRERGEKASGQNIAYEFSPESFSATEPDYAIEVCQAVLDELGATPDKKVILNLPSTVQLSTPNLYADLIEYFIRNLPGRDSAIISVHPHNDRGTGVADAELAFLAGAIRCEGTLFGNGERTGNVDLVTLALNMYTQGVDPGLDFSNINGLKKTFERSTGMRVYERSPYAGDLVFTAFAGTHQDAIRKYLNELAENGGDYWEAPYLPIDPADIGRQYEPIIRINSQSGKGGAAYVLGERFGFNLPRAMHSEFGALVTREADQTSAELTPEQLLRLFLREYVGVSEPYSLTSHVIEERGHGGHSTVSFKGAISSSAGEHPISGEGNGPIDAFFSAMKGEQLDGFRFASYHEHAVSSGSDAKAVAYIELIYKGHSVFGVGIESNVSIASIKGVLSAINRALTGA